jgi:hypothetical protein
MKKTILALLFPVLIFAQDYELGKVTVSELSQKKHPTDTSAVAAILFNVGKTYFEYEQNTGFSLITEVDTKIKIYKKEGYNWANKEVEYYVGGNKKVNVTFSKAFTYNLVNGKVEKTKLNSDNEFKINVDKFWDAKKISMPNVKEGSIIEFKYTIKSPYFSNIPEWNFQNVVPVDYSSYTIEIPEYYTYNPYFKGGLTTVKSSSKDSKEITTVYEDNGVRGLNSDVRHEKQYNKVNYIINKNNFTLKNVPALLEESYTNNIKNYLSSVNFELASIHFPGQNIEYYSETWEDVVKTIYKSESFGSELNKENYFQSEFSGLLDGKQLSNGEKISTIFEFVKNHYKWNEYNGIYTDVGVNKAFKDKVGNVVEINFTLVAMLRKAGFKANPILLTTRSKAITEFPSSSAFNYVICGVELDNKIIYLDATDKYLAENVLPSRALNYIGRIVRENGSSEMVDLSPKVHSKKTVMIFATVSPENIKGNIKEVITENRSYNFRDMINGISEDSYLEKVEKETAGLEISDYTMENKTNLKEPLKEDYNFVLTNQVETINDKLYFKPLLFFGIDENPFKSETRDYPIDFKYPTHDSYTITYNLPQGYVVESMPEKINIATEDNLASLSFLTGNMGNKVQIVANLYINSALMPADYYDSIKSFFNEVYVKMNQKIVLKKQ